MGSVSHFTLHSMRIALVQDPIFKASSGRIKGYRRGIHASYKYYRLSYLTASKWAETVGQDIPAIEEQRLNHSLHET
jgi:hypothetical protein